MTKKKKRTKAAPPPKQDLSKAGIQRHLLIWHRRAGKDVWKKIASKYPERCMDYFPEIFV